MAINLVGLYNTVYYAVTKEDRICYNNICKTIGMHNGLWSSEQTIESDREFCENN